MPRERTSTLSFIKDRVWQQIQGWKAKLFSVRGREVLLKSIIQDISRAMALFWWNGDKENRRIHWVSWKTLCKLKCLGGMGFRDLEVFNQALLAKQCWRIMQQSTSFLTRVLKGRYFWRLRWGRDPLSYGESDVGERASEKGYSLESGKW